MRTPLRTKAAYLLQIGIAFGLSCSAYAEHGGHGGGGGGHAGGGGGGAAPHVGGGGGGAPHFTPAPAPHFNPAPAPHFNPAPQQHAGGGHPGGGQVPHNGGGGMPPHQGGGGQPHNNPFNPGTPGHNPNNGNPIHNGGVVHNPNNGNPIHNGGVVHNPNQGQPVRPHIPANNPFHPNQGIQHPVGPMNVAHHGNAPVWNGNPMGRHPVGESVHPLYNRGNVTQYVGANHGFGSHGPVPNLSNAINHPGRPSYYTKNWSTNNYNRTNNLFRTINIQHNTVIINHVGGFWNNYGRVYSPWWGSLGRYYSGIYSGPYRYCYQPYFNYGFYGGYFYPVNPLTTVLISTQMYYPAFYWLYSSDPSPVYYQSYYGQQAVEQAPVEAFAYANYLLPTDALAKLTEEVSGDAAAFATFRERMTMFIDQIQQRVNDLVGAQVPLTNGGIVLNRYENLNNGAAYMIEGMVEAKVTMSDGNIKAVQFGLQGILDMQDPQGTGVFIPSSDEPNPDDLNALQALNKRITDLGGTPNVPQIEPPIGDAAAPPAQP